MTSRERVLSAVNFQKPDRVPIDLGAFRASGINAVVYDKLIQRHNFAPSTAIMVEDMAKNLIPAAALGMTTVWVKTGRPWAHAEAEALAPDHQTDNLSEWLAGVAGI